MASGEFKQLAKASQTTQRLIFEHCWAETIKAGSELLMGDCPLAVFSAAHVRVLRDHKADLPGAANNRIKLLRRLFSWAETDFPKLGNPAKTVKPFSVKSSGFHHWSLDEISQYEARHPVGTKARLALDLLLYTAVRRSDVVKLGHKHIDREGWLVFSQTKTGSKVEIPIVSRLAETLAIGPTGKSFFLETEESNPFTAAGFDGKMRQWCDQAELPQCSAHGLRKVAAAKLAELGCSDREIMAITGHQSAKEVSIYTKGARRRIMARSGMDKMEAALVSKSKSPT
jgi:integrase